MALLLVGSLLCDLGFGSDPRELSFLSPYSSPNCPSVWWVFYSSLHLFQTPPFLLLSFNRRGFLHGDRQDTHIYSLNVGFLLSFSSQSES